MSCWWRRRKPSSDLTRSFSQKPWRWTTVRRAPAHRRHPVADDPGEAGDPPPLRAGTGERRDRTGVRGDLPQALRRDPARPADGARKGQKNGSFKASCEPSMQCDVVCAFIDGLALQAVSEPSRTPPARIVELVTGELEASRIAKRSPVAPSEAVGCEVQGCVDFALLRSPTSANQRERLGSSLGIDIFIPRLRNSSAQ